MKFIEVLEQKMLINRLKTSFNPFPMRSLLQLKQKNNGEINLN